MAAGAGFDPDGTRALMALMGERLPQSKEYGYWRTHPFFDQRVRAADVRAELLKIQESTPDEEYRKQTQEILLEYREDHLPDPKKADARDDADQGDDGRERLDLVKLAALNAWPRGEAADELRWENLELARDRELDRPELSRDFGRLIELFRIETEEVRELSPESSLPSRLDQELAAFDRQLEELYPRAVETYRTGIYETEFLTTFQSNYPEAPERPEIALDLGRAFSRLRRPDDAVSHYLSALTAGTGTEIARQARSGLRNLAPVLDRLAPLQELADQQDDRELQGLAARRLAELASSFEDLPNGAAYLRKYPGGEYAETVAERLNNLAENLYGELVLYQTVGDHVKALERIQTILLEAPLSRAAARLRQAAVLES